jgi:hypothetical protein
MILQFQAPDIAISRSQSMLGFISFSPTYTCASCSNPLLHQNSQKHPNPLQGRRGAERDKFVYKIGSRPTQDTPEGRPPGGCFLWILFLQKQRKYHAVPGGTGTQMPAPQGA